MSKEKKKQPSAVDSYKGVKSDNATVILKDTKTGKETKIKI